MIKNNIKNLINNYQEYKYHKWHKIYANRALKVIESIKGKTDSKLLKLSNEYAEDILGWLGYAPWLYVYCAVSGNFKEGWIPDNYYGKVVSPAIKGNYGYISNLRSLINTLFKSDLFPDLAYYVNGLLFTIDYKILPENILKELVFKNSDLVVFKTDSSLQGRGVFFFDKSNFDINKIRTLGNGVFQKYINQHSFFKEFMPSSVSTIRMTTVIDDNGNSTLRGCYLRIGRNQDTHLKGESLIRVSVNLETGELSENGFMPNWSTIDKHPDTNILFANKYIPNFTKCISKTIELHNLFPLAQCIGWDMIVDENNNINIMEWNGGHNDIKFSEATQGPCFSDLGWDKLWKK